MDTRTQSGLDVNEPPSGMGTLYLDGSVYRDLVDSCTVAYSVECIPNYILRKEILLVGDVGVYSRLVSERGVNPPFQRDDSITGMLLICSHSKGETFLVVN